MAPNELDSFALRDLPEGQLHSRVLKSGKKVVIVRQGDHVQVFNELCPHMGADLAEGWYCAEKRTLQCRWHGYLFSTDDGRFLENPNEKLMKLVRIPSKHYDPDKTPKYRLAVVPSQVEGDRVIVGKRAATSSGVGQDDGAENAAEGDRP